MIADLAFLPYFYRADNKAVCWVFSHSFFRIKLKSFDFRTLIFCALTFSERLGDFKALKRGKLSQKHLLVNEALETHLSKTKGFVFHACHPLLATHKLRYRFEKSIHF